MSEEGRAERPRDATTPPVTGPAPAGSLPLPSSARTVGGAPDDAGDRLAAGAGHTGAGAYPVTSGPGTTAPATSDPSAPSAGDDAAAGEAAPSETPLKVPHTRTSATYIGVAVGLVLLVLIIIFIAQNPSKASVHFIGFRFELQQGLIVLASAVVGGLIVLVVSLARVLQLRLMARRHRKAHQPA